MHLVHELGQPCEFLPVVCEVVVILHVVYIVPLRILEIKSYARPFYLACHIKWTTSDQNRNYFVVLGL